MFEAQIFNDLSSAILALGEIVRFSNSNSNDLYNNNFNNNHISSVIKDINKIDVSDLHHNAKQNSVYIAIRGAKFNGEDFIGEAIRKKARFIVACKDYQPTSRLGISTIEKNLFIIQDEVIEEQIENSNSFKTNDFTSNTEFNHKKFDHKNTSENNIKYNQNITYWHEFFSQAILQDKIIIILVNNTRLALSYLASCLHSKQPEKIVAITGTNGKTSTCYFFAQICSFSNYNAGTIGTLGAMEFPSQNLLSSQVLPEHENPSEIIDKDVTNIVNNLTLTTPSPISLYSQLDEFAYKNITHVAIEASSHGLDQYRLDFVKLTGAGFTNLSQDHLDYHHNMESYYNAKKALFCRLSPSFAVINESSTYYSDLSNAYLSSRDYISDNKKNSNQNSILSYGNVHSKIYTNDVNTPLHNIKLVSYDGENLILSLNSHIYHSKCYLIAEFQIENLLCAIGLAYGAGIPIDSIIKLIPYIKNPPGRMEEVIFFPKKTNEIINENKNSKNQQNVKKIAKFNKEFAKIYIDYAHTPEGLELALKQLKKNCQGNLILIFGCGGERDETKRAIMGEIACKYANTVIVTNDNPRKESAGKIRSDIIKGCNDYIKNCDNDKKNAKHHGKNIQILEIPDRKDAIKYGIQKLKIFDFLLIAGKGHEIFQIVGENKIPYNDMECVKTTIELL